VASLRGLIWALVLAAALAALAAVLASSADATLASGRERLLAGDAATAETRFGRARLWPATRATARAGVSLARALRGESPIEPTDQAALRALQPASVLEAALARGDGVAAAAVAEVALRAGDPLGPLYAAAFALDRRDVPAARALAGESRAPLTSRRAGKQLQQALALYAGGARTLARDRDGALIGSLDGGGRFQLAEGIDAALVPGPMLEALAAMDPGPELSGIRLSLDLSLSRLALGALGAWRGTVVLLEPDTGAVLAAVSDPRTARREGAPAFTQRREPASIAKILTTAAAYRAGIDADAAIRAMDCEGVERYGGEPLWCASPAGPLQGLEHALAVSCNIAFANLAMRIGSARLLEEFRLWGFDAEPPALLGAAGRLRPPPRTQRELADLSVGLEQSDITPLHAALLAATVANEGRMPEPRLVSGRCGALGLSDAPAPPPAGRAVLDAATLAILRRAMEAVALYGTGAALAPSGLPIAMKTGTAAEWRRGYHVNYVGYAPARNPGIAFCVRITHQPSSWAVNRVGRDVTRRLLRGLARSSVVRAGAARGQRRLP
jgi:peptidoglycan glycosyltransferase